MGGFEPPLSHFIIATTAPRDVEPQKFVREFSDRRRAEGRFSLDLFAWDDLQDWLQGGPEPISRAKALWVWRQRILRLYSSLMPYFQERSAPLLEHVYVELQLDPERLRGAAGVGSPEVRSMELLSRRLLIRDVLELDRTEHPWITRRWLLRGDPGSGKTTLLRHLARTLADAGGEPWVPVFESLPRLMADRLSVFGRIEEDLERADQPGVEIRRILEEEAGKGRLLLLLDGLDEVPREARDRAETLLSELAARWPKSPIVATTRLIGAWSPGPEFLELEVLPFDAYRRRAFLERWFGPENSESAASAADILEADRGLRELASNPLYLTLLALLIQDGKEPARYRSQLYDQIFDLLEEGRHHKPPTPIDNRKVAHQGLCQLAYRMTEDNRDTEAMEAIEGRLLNDRQLRASLRVTWPRVRDYLDDVAEKTGILGPHDGREVDWRFWHRTFREALAAQRMAEALTESQSSDSMPDWLMRLWQILRSRGIPGLLKHVRRVSREDLGRWAEPYALLVGRVEEPDALVRALVEANPALGLLAVATTQSLRNETLREVLKLSAEWRQRARVFERLPELIDDPLRAVALADELRQRTRNGNDLFFLERAVMMVGEKWPDAKRIAMQLRKRFYDHIPRPPEELFRSIDTPMDGRVELWREIPAGEFLMGSPWSELEGSDLQRPPHKVVVESDFRIAAVPMTIAQFAAFDPEHIPYHRGNLANYPVESVTWYQAFTFCRWLSSAFPWAQGARLPKEEEWEYACRAGTQTRYWSGEQEADLAEVGWFNANSDARPHRVGEKPANPWGLYDMHGNVWEWTLRKWTGNYDGRERGFKFNPSTVDPTDLAFSRRVRPIRGGGFADSAVQTRAASRYGGSPEIDNKFLGFRIVLPGVPKPRSEGSA